MKIVVHPNLNEVRIARGHFLNSLAGLLGCCGTINLVGIDLHCRSATGRADSAIGCQNSRAKETSFPLLGPELIQEIFVHAERHHGCDTVPLVLRELPPY